MLLIGSAAAKYFIESFREPKDYDLIVASDELGKFYNANKDSIVEFRPQYYKDRFTCRLYQNLNIVRVEVHVAQDGSSHRDLMLAQKHYHTVNALNCEMVVASLRTLFLLKKTHIYLPIKWSKHIQDYQILKQYNSSLTDNQQDNELLDSAISRISEETKARFSKGHVSLDMTNEEFFARSAAYVNRKYNHDDLHNLVAFYDAPMYTKLKDDQSKAMCLRSKWDELNFEDKVRSVKEEAYVIALERKIIPAYERGDDITHKLYSSAFAWAVERICTTLTSGWFREFAVDNWLICGPNNEDYSFVGKYLNWDKK